VSADNHKWMRAALSLARRGHGNVAPNPAVGCLIVKGGTVVGRGWTQPGGRPHAETCALDMAGAKASGASAYVTLEPCAHIGETGPCAQALIGAGIAEVFIAAIDPDSRVSGKGVDMLKAAGIHVHIGMLEAEALTLNAGFIAAKTMGRPLFALKSAATIDGRIATKTGDSKWITGPEARRYGHMLRATHDAILVGVNTVIADNPALDCRILGLEHRSPTPVVLDNGLRIPLNSQLIGGGVQPILVCSKKAAATERASLLQKQGAQLLPVEDTHDLSEVAKALSSQGFTRVLVEGGGQVLASFLQAGYCDIYYSFTAAKYIGADGLAAVGAFDLAELKDAPHLTLETIRKIGADLLATYVNAE
jgi:diaminohydroxyphosphoribosylaminopyrimidine deaminase / 5-amino-6-(5-phosphoribosylamino)uracil reductase